jgi:hypothetical protein
VRNAALVARHPGWLGIHHPELIALPPRRYSQLDMLPAVEAGRAQRYLDRAAPSDAHARRVERNATIVAQHPRWRGILHPDRIFFPEPRPEGEPLFEYRAAVRRALKRERESQELCARIESVAASIARRRWPWSASPAELRCDRPPTSPPRITSAATPAARRPRRAVHRPARLALSP